MNAKFFGVLAGATLLAACSTFLPTAATDTAQDIAAAQLTYQGLAAVAVAYESNAAATQAQKTAIAQADAVAFTAIDTAVKALSACPLAAGSTTNFDSTCANSAVITGALATAVSAIQQFSTTLNANGVTQ